MNWTTTVRRFGAAAAVAALTSFAAAPAFAQSDPVTVDVLVPDITVPVGGSNDAVSVTIDSSHEATLEDLTFTFDVGELAGVAAIDPDSSSCTTSGTEVVCTESFPTFVPAGPFGILPLQVTADPGAVAGGSGTMGVTVEATGVDPVSDTATVTVGAPVDLAADGDAEFTAAVGDPLPVPLTVHNAGVEPAEGVALRVSSHFPIRQQDRHSNCSYYPNPIFSDYPGNSLCTFDVVLEPGATYTLSSPMAFEVGTDAGAPRAYAIFAEWMTRSEGATAGAGKPSGEPGTGPELTLEQAGGGAPAPVSGDPLPAADVDPANDHTTHTVNVAGDNQPDFAAVGDQVAGEVGDLVTAEVGVANAGPAAASNDGSGEPVNHVRVTIPEGTTATDVPGTCSPLLEGEHSVGDPGTPGEADYRCVAEFVLPVDEQKVFPFVLRIDEVIPDATGVVQVNQSIGQPTPPSDYNPDNDEAVLVVNPASGSGGGGLPVTGAATWMIAAAGGLLLALGAAGVLLVRRRQTQFVA